MELTLLLVIAVFATNVYLHKPVLESFLFALALAVGLTPATAARHHQREPGAWGEKDGRAESDREAPGLHRELRQHGRALLRQDRNPDGKHRDPALHAGRGRRGKPPRPPFAYLNATVSDGVRQPH